ncbi:hypothetical protein Q9R30_00285 [Arthrobacter sp. AB6]|uniref:hypothetical protein n=1 Tax=Arthrobacter sp. AB6 TaxID=2962570 RepID=UPI00288263AD|nr:hypothetical protein [Arthrobacter sp. AB6]MDT0193789.1 hypothetical protein [Arthrobacter sp. AB6]
MTSTNGKQSVPAAEKSFRRRGLLRLGTLITAFTGASAVTSAGGAQAAPGDKNPATAYVPLAEKGAPAGVATLDTSSKIPSSQIPDLSSSFVQVREAPLTPYQFGAVAPVASSDNTAALSQMWAAACDAANPEIRLPAGYWNTTGPTAGCLPLVTNMKVSGAGRLKTRLTISASSSRPMFTWNTETSGVDLSSMFLNVGAGGSDIFAPGPTGGLHASTFRNMFINQQHPGRRIWWQDNAASFIHNTFEDVEMQRVTAATVPAFQVHNSGGAANFNLFKQVRINGYNCTSSPFFSFESTLPQTFLTDWTFINLLGEQNPGGMIHAAGAFNWTLVNATDEDATVPYSSDLFRFSANSAGLAPRNLTFVGCGRRGSSMAPAAYEFNIAPSGANVTLINCNPTPTSATTKALLPRSSTIIGSRNYPQTLQGAGSPEGSVSAVIGSTWMRTDGGPGTSFYVKESGTSATGWAAK